jgi:hypothetical protein
VNFGAAATGGTIANLETRLAPGGVTPGAAQPLFDFTSYNTANPGAPLTLSRFGNVSVSPNNSRIAFAGTDSGNVYVLNYNAGATPGTGVGASVSNGTQVGGLTTGSASNTYSTAWIDNNNFVLLNNPTNGGSATSTLKKVTVGAGGALTMTDVANVNFGAGTAAFGSLMYEPNLSPYVYAGFSQFSGATINRLLVLDPNNNFAQVGSFDFSTSMNTARELAFDSHGNLIWSEFGNTTSVPLGGTIETIPGGNKLSNLQNNVSQKYYIQNQTAALSAQFSGVDVAASSLDYKFAGVDVDVRGKQVVVPYFDPTSPLSVIGAKIASGFAGNTWTGPGIRSSVAAADPNHRKAIGYAESTDVGLGSGSFGGQQIQGPSILVRLTLYGDANLDATVNTTDFNLLAANFGGSGKYWAKGDFNYDGNVNTTDFNLLAGNFGQTLSADEARGLGAIVPEPTSLATVAVAAVGLAARRRRK